MMQQRHFLLVVVWAAACGTSTSDQRPVSERAGVARGSTDSMSASSWPSAIGGVLAIASTTPGEALLFRRDTTTAPGQVSVVGYDPLAAVATVRDIRATPCAARATLRLDGAPLHWNLALDTSRAHPVLVDALEDLSPTDSQRLVIRIQRALNALPDTGAAMEFRGLPVVVRDAWIVRLSPAPIVVARAARLRNLEAAAHEELRFVVLEDDQPLYVARVAGDEETIESWDLLAVLMIAGQPWLAVAREGVNSLQLELVTRDNTGWHSAWRSDVVGCRNSR